MWSTCLEEVAFLTYHRSGSHLCHHPEPPTRHFEKEPAGTLEHQGAFSSSAPRTWLWTEHLAHWLSYKTPLSGCCGPASYAGFQCYRGTHRDTHSLFRSMHKEFTINNRFAHAQSCCTMRIVKYENWSLNFLGPREVFIGQNLLWGISTLNPLICKQGHTV